MLILTCYFLSIILLYTKQIKKMVTFEGGMQEEQQTALELIKMAHQSASSWLV